MDEKEIYNNSPISIVKSQLLTDFNLSRNRKMETLRFELHNGIIL